MTMVKQQPARKVVIEVRGQQMSIDSTLMEKKINYVLKSMLCMPAAKNCYEGDGAGAGARADKIEGCWKRFTTGL
jgi:hypothetical protein